METDGRTGPLGHDHVFLGDDHERNERKVRLVIALTAVMMVAEVAAGTIFGSMALLADGWHMATHAGALLITALAYAYARRHARDPRFAFGTGKFGDLAGFANAVVLALVALLIAWASLVRLVEPVPIDFREAIVVSVVGLIVNLASAWILAGHHGHHGHDHGHGGRGHHHGPDHHHEPHGHHGHHAAGHRHDHDADHHHHHHHDHDAGPRRSRDNNLTSAYLHVLADALTSVAAILALIVGATLGWVWADPAIGLIGAAVIARWSVGLIRDTGGVLVDRVPVHSDLPGAIRSALETGEDRIVDLHVWQVGPGHCAAIVSLASPAPLAPAGYKSRLRHIDELSHVTVEVEALIEREPAPAR